jgi:hypothetical protein
VALSTPLVVGGGRSHPRPLGVVRPPPKAPNPFFFSFFLPFGVAGPPLGWPPPRACWGLRPPHTGRMGHPQNPFSLFFFFFFFLAIWGWPDYPLGQGGSPAGWFGGGRTTPMAKGVVRPPLFPLFFFFFNNYLYF